MTPDTTLRSSGLCRLKHVFPKVKGSNEVNNNQGDLRGLTRPRKGYGTLPIPCTSLSGEKHQEVVVVFDDEYVMYMLTFNVIDYM